jgi:hypothetical protein
MEGLGAALLFVRRCGCSLLHAAVREKEGGRRKREEKERKEKKIKKYEFFSKLKSFHGEK